MAAAAAAARPRREGRGYQSRYVPRCRPWHLGILASLPPFRTASTASLLWLGLCLHLSPRLATLSAVLLLCGVCTQYARPKLHVRFSLPRPDQHLGGRYKVPAAMGSLPCLSRSFFYSPFPREKNTPTHRRLPSLRYYAASCLVVCTSCRSPKRASLTSPHPSRRALKLFASRPMRMRKPKPTPPTPKPMSASASCRTRLH
jgi:hypothetical protein